MVYFLQRVLTFQNSQDFAYIFVFYFKTFQTLILFFSFSAYDVQLRIFVAICSLASESKINLLFYFLSYDLLQFVQNALQIFDI